MSMHLSDVLWSPLTFCREIHNYAHTQTRARPHTACVCDCVCACAGWPISQGCRSKVFVSLWSTVFWLFLLRLFEWFLFFSRFAKNDFGWNPVLPQSLPLETSDHQQLRSNKQRSHGRWPGKNHCLTESGSFFLNIPKCQITRLHATVWHRTANMQS